MPTENKKNYEKEDIHTDKLDHWYGDNNVHGGTVLMIVIAISLIGLIYGIFKLTTIN